MKTLNIKYLFAAFVMLFATYALKAQKYDPAHWMESLPDSLYICSLTIPGTHDAFTYNCTTGTGPWAKAQTKSIEEQFKCGVRAFDVRPGYDHIRFSLRIQHGIVDCGYTFEEGLKMIEDIVDGTDEFVIVFVSREGGSKDDNKLIYEVEAKKKGNDKLYVQEFRPDLTLGDVRGRILIINRDDLRVCGEKVIGAFANGYPGAGMTELSVGGMKASGGKVVCKFYVQDKDNYEKDSEWWECKGKYFEEIADKYFREKDYFTWCSNHTSGWCGKYGATMDYNENADKMNNYVANTYIPDHLRLTEKGAWRGLGLVMMDFAGETKYGSHNVYGDVLVKALIDINFAASL